MAIPAWTENLSVANAELDGHHKKMIELLIGLWQTVERGDGGDAVTDILRELLQLTVRHNAAEEKHMHDHHFPGAVQHARLHEHLIHELRKTYLVPLSKGQLQITEKAVASAARLLIDHIKSEDKKYAAYVAARGAVPSA
ncbi:MAG: hemerythrin domain-containing protein [candidate division Zixibacteria bacterium]|nr:hemerythrin domain-containing protein [candidate division Zixibacteria bacterium]